MSWELFGIIVTIILGVTVGSILVAYFAEAWEKESILNGVCR